MEIQSGRFEKEGTKIWKSNLDVLKKKEIEHENPI